MILTPSKKIIRPRFKSLDDLMRHRERLEKDIAVDLLATVAVSEKGKCLGKETFRCQSFLANWMKVMKLMLADTDESIVNALDGVAYTCQHHGSQDLLNIGQVTEPTLGPVIGTGTTAPTPNDTKLEQQITNGTAAPNASVLTGTTHASSSSAYTIYDNGTQDPSISADLFNQYFIELTSGALSGQERIIYDTVEASPDYFSLYAASNGAGGFGSDTDVDGVTYKIKTYGMMTYGTVGFTPPEDDGDLTSTMTITRSFANGCGQTLDVTEFGLMVTVDVASSQPIRPLVIRDTKATPVSIANGQELTLTYTFACEA